MYITIYEIDHQSGFDPRPGLGRSPGEGNGNSLQYSCLKNLMDTGAWQTTGYGVTESDTTKVT